MRKRILILPVAAAVIATLCVYRIATIDPNAPPPVPPSSNRRPAHVFALDNANMEKVRLSSFLGRHQILIAFFDGTVGADRDPIVDRLRRDFDKVKATDTKVYAISTALPQDDRKIIEKSGPFPFPLLSDPGRQVHDQWGVGEGDKHHPISLLFFIDRAGNVDYGKNAPRPVDFPQRFIDRLLHGR